MQARVGWEKREKWWLYSPSGRQIASDWPRSQLADWLCQKILAPAYRRTHCTAHLQQETPTSPARIYVTSMRTSFRAIRWPMSIYECCNVCAQTGLARFSSSEMWVLVWSESYGNSQGVLKIGCWGMSSHEPCSFFFVLVQGYLWGDFGQYDSCCALMRCLPSPSNFNSVSWSSKFSKLKFLHIFEWGPTLGPLYEGLNGSYFCRKGFLYFFSSAMVMDANYCSFSRYKLKLISIYITCTIYVLYLYYTYIYYTCLLHVTVRWICSTFSLHLNNFVKSNLSR